MALPSASAPPSARARVDEARRDQMRRRLIESAIYVFAERGASDVVIRDVITDAGVARGSFYNHFRSNEEVLEAACLAICAELVETVEAEVAKAPSAAQALHLGTALLLGIAQDYPILGRFMSMLTLQSSAQLMDLSRNLPAIVASGIAAGQFCAEDPRAIIDLKIGLIRQAALRLGHHPTPPEDPEAFCRSTCRLILRAAGLPQPMIEQIVAPVLPRIRLPEDSLLAKAQHRHDTHRDATPTKDHAQ